MLFGKKRQKTIQTVWTIIALLVIVSMVLLYSPFFF